MNGGMVTWVRWVGLVEGVSFLLLLGVAMPLKYFANWPTGVSVVGMAHGVLFLAYVGLIVGAYAAGRLGGRLSLWSAVAAVVPFGPFLIDRKLREVEAGGTGHEHDPVGPPAD